MTQATVKLQIPFDSLLNAIKTLNLEEKRKLWELLDAEITEAEDNLLEEDPTIKAEIEAARLAYQAGDYLTLEDYMAKRAGKTEAN